MVSDAGTPSNECVRHERHLYDHAGDPLPSLESDAGRIEICNARRLVAMHGEIIRYCDKWNSWLVWDGKRWRIDDVRRIEHLAKDVYYYLRRELDRLEPIRANKKDDPLSAEKSFARASGTHRGLEAMLKLARSEIGVPVRESELDADPWALNMLNGTLDLRTGELRPHLKADNITKLCEVEYNPNAICPRWLLFLNRIMAGNQELIAFLQRAAGYSLTGDTNTHAVFILWGTGANGKSTFMGTLLRLWGRDYSMKAPPTC